MRNPTPLCSAPTHPGPQPRIRAHAQHLHEPQPVILFVIYAGAVWMLCFAQRRRPLGVLAGLVAAAPIAMAGLWLNRGHDTLTVWSIGVFAFAGLVGLIALFLAAQPRRPSSACDACGYDLHGIASHYCPECGDGAAPSQALPAAPVALGALQIEALRARRARARWSATDSPSTSAAPTPAASAADVHARAS